MREPGTHGEFTPEFVMYASECIWKMTRRDNQFLRDQEEDEEGESETYQYDRDYKDIFSLRSVFGYSMAMLDVLWKIGYFESMDKVCVPNWLFPRIRSSIQQLFMNIVLPLYQISRDSGEYEIDHYIFYVTQRFLTNRLVLEMNNEDEISAICAGMLVNVLAECERSRNSEQLLTVFGEVMLNTIRGMFG
jgi:hypothetical protein